MIVKKKHTLLLLTAAFFCSILNTNAYAFEDEDARRAILDLRAQLRQSAQARLELSNKIQSLQTQVSQLRGEIERLSSADTLSRQSARAEAGFDPTPQVGDPNEQRAYDEALDLFRQGNYSQSSVALGNFATAYPNSPLTPSARFYEGSSLYASKDFRGAIQRLQSMVAAYPSDPKAGDALLVIAGSQVELNNIAGAKTTLQSIINQYPDTPSADTAKQRLELFR
ncbi:tol-pal system protein YbgF [Advenella faeciporci]|uniref:Cell division coordinator CpoB n=1 Tax=Advenella faeciporci TaxID=797535 RepID=A0A918MYI9_9BURK|nr:tol-pal system protein YbgF [Advenella faeciporci]GGW88428.1 tol-pal system protein YbgF [Advenella faeciporci]